METIVVLSRKFRLSMIRDCPGNAQHKTEGDTIVVTGRLISDLLQQHPPADPLNVDMLNELLRCLDGRIRAGGKIVVLHRIDGDKEHLPLLCLDSTAQPWATRIFIEPGGYWPTDYWLLEPQNA